MKKITYIHIVLYICLPINISGSFLGKSWPWQKNIFEKSYDVCKKYSKKAEKLVINNETFDYFLAFTSTLSYPTGILSGKRALALQWGIVAKHFIAQRFYFNNQNSNFFKTKNENNQKIATYAVALAGVSTCYAVTTTGIYKAIPFFIRLLAPATRLVL